MNITIENNIQEMSVIHSKLKEYYIDMGIEDETSKKISIIIDEVVSNIILYGYDDNDKHYITLSLVPNLKDYRLEVVDDGKYFDPIEYLQSHVIVPNSDQTGGVGIRLIHTISSEMKYKRLENQNILSVIIPNYQKKVFTNH